MAKFIESDVLSHVNDVVILINPEDKIIFVNPMLENLIGSKVKLMGQGVAFFINQLGIDISSDLLNDFRKNLPLKDVEHICKRDDGGELHLLWSFLPHVPHGVTEGIVIIGKDITELKKLSFQVEKLDNIIKYAPDWIYWKNKELVYLGCNERFAKAAGYSCPEDIIGKSDRELVWYKYAHKYNYDDQEVINSGAAKFDNEDIVPLGDDGAYAIVISNKVPLCDPQGNTIGILGISTDITKQKKTEEALLHAQAAAEQLERLDNIVKYAPDWIYWKDKNLIYLGCNDQLAIAAGFQNRHDMIGKSDFEMPWFELAAKYRQDDKEVIESGEPKLSIEETVTTRDGKEIITITNKVPLRGINGEVIGVLGIATDITDRKKAEQDLVKIKAAEKANALKTHFIQNMQHDIRTPASSMWAVLDDLVRSHQLPDYDVLTLLRDSAKQLHRICNEVIDFDRIEYGDRPILSKKIAIHEIVSMVIELNKIAAHEKGLKLSLEVDENVPKVVKGDEHRLSRILVNLIGNALKFTQNGSVCLSVHLIQEREKEYIIQFKLQDTGMGISVENQATLYEKFNRLTPSNRGTYSGTGLGLRIVKKYVDELKGEISVDSAPNKGTIFYIDIPFEKALVETIYERNSTNQLIPSDEFTQSEKESKLVSRRLLSIKTEYNALLIEDNLAAMKIGTLFLQALHCDVTVAADVKNALVALQARKFDFVVSDMGLPDGTGIDIIKAVKKDSASINFSTPFFVLTANADQATISDAEKAGFLSVMIKPMQKEKIQFLVDNYVKNSSPQNNKSESQQLVGLDLPAEESDLFKLEQYPILDLAEGISLLGDEATLREILGQLIVELPENIVELQQAHSTKDWPQVEKLAHKAKGGAAYVGTVRMKYACQYLERYCKAGYSKCLEELYQQLIEVLNETQLYVKKWLVK